ncbi:hypothetical protein BT63DRAFT_415851 [Microthyrium microscopicum]|uniref:Uncharacterized protein n=1 Tax=Microthyrium microscopicum TaxID=703497 RepID=A0A6A6U716_9PEZI|nr:hypothetical protein BT63DRAFT_415851 [Microthyrium microscopicum]
MSPNHPAFHINQSFQPNSHLPASSRIAQAPQPPVDSHHHPELGLTAAQINALNSYQRPSSAIDAISVDNHHQDSSDPLDFVDWAAELKRYEANGQAFNISDLPRIVAYNEAFDSFAGSVEKANLFLSRVLHTPELCNIDVQAEVKALGWDFHVANILLVLQQHHKVQFIMNESGQLDFNMPGTDQVNLGFPELNQYASSSGTMAAVGPHHTTTPDQSPADAHVVPGFMEDQPHQHWTDGHSGAQHGHRFDLNYAQDQTPAYGQMHNTGYHDQPGPSAYLPGPSHEGHLQSQGQHQASAQQSRVPQQPTSAAHHAPSNIQGNVPHQGAVGNQVSGPQQNDNGYMSDSDDRRAILQADFEEMNSLPQDQVSANYKNFVPSFQTLQEANDVLHQYSWRPAPLEHDDMPRNPTNDAYVLKYSKKFFKAMTNFSRFHDKTETKNKVNRLVSQKYHQNVLWARCIQMYHHVVELHSTGCFLMPSMDPTMEAKGNDYKVKPKALEDRNLSFKNRIREICFTLRTSKAACSDILDGGKMESVIVAPILAVRVKKENAANNGRKQETLEVGKETIKERKRKREQPASQVPAQAAPAHYTTTNNQPVPVYHGQPAQYQLPHHGSNQWMDHHDGTYDNAATMYDGDYFVNEGEETQGGPPYKTQRFQH